MTKPELKWLCYFALFMTCFSSCRRESIETIAPSEFTKDQQESLGDMLRESIASNSGSFELLPKEAPYDTSVYWLIQRLYDQATNVMRIDHQSPTDDRWTSDRKWDVHIIVSDEINAFVLPSGYFYITTGFLKTLKEEYELYYILSFEANLMNKGLLLERLFSEVSSTKLIDMVARDLPPGNEEVTRLARTVSKLSFSEDETQRNDRYTVDDICNTSLWNRFGLLSVLETVDDHREWLTFRPSYPGREEWLLSYQPESIEHCGAIKTNNPSGEGYKRYVLDHLN